MLIKGALAKKIIQRTGLGHDPGNIRHRIRQVTDEHTRHKLLDRYNSLLLGKPIIKHDLEDFLHTLGDKKVVNLGSGTYIYTIAHNPHNVIRDSEHELHAEERKRMMEQAGLARDTSKKELEDEKNKKKEEREEKEKEKKEEIKRAHESVTPPHSRTPTMKGGKLPLAPHIG